MSDVQLRTYEGDICIAPSVREAFEVAESNPEVWKISWSEGEHRIRLVRHTEFGDSTWRYDPLDRYLNAVAAASPRTRPSAPKPS